MYERSMGRWSRLLAPAFLEFAGSGERVLDVGCGTGSLLLELAASPAPRVIAGIDASPIYAASARERLRDERVTVLNADAYAIPFATGSFDCALSQLVLQFIPDPAAALAEMRRVVRSRGTLAAAVWNSGGGMPHQRMFLDTAVMLDPAATKLRANTFSRPSTRAGELATLFAAAGLEEVTEGAATIAMDFADFDDYWAPLQAGEGTLGKYVAALTPELGPRVREAVREAYLSGGADGRRVFHCTAYLCRGRTRS